MKVEQIYTGCLAQGAYYILSEGEAVIIDPLRETKPYIEKLKADNATLKYIFETHFHADFVSGHIDLAKSTGATIVYGPDAEAAFEKYDAKDGEILPIGNISFKVLHTPGHTPESTTYLLRDEAEKEYAIFTGDTLFLGDVGRPDLAQKGEEMTIEDLASTLFDSLRQKIMPLGDNIIIYPGHGAGSACGKNMTNSTVGTLGEQKMTNYALRADMAKDEFIKEVTEGLLPPPQYFAKNARMNKMGYESIDKVLQQGVVSLSPKQFEEIANRQEALILDTRTPNEYCAAHIPNSIFIGIDGSFAPWVGALILDLRQAILIIAPEGREEEVVTRLARVGYDNTFGYLAGGINAWQAAGKDTANMASVSADELANLYKTSPNIIDVRKDNEYHSGHIKKATHIPLSLINKNMDKFNAEPTYYIHCRSGYRSVIAGSILQARGIKNIINVLQGFQAIEKTAIPQTHH